MVDNSSPNTLRNLDGSERKHLLKRKCKRKVTIIYSCVSRPYEEKGRVLDIIEKKEEAGDHRVEEKKGYNV